MRIGVIGLWHLGTVTAACLASAGHAIIGFDPDPETVDRLVAGRLPVFEPGLEDLIRGEMKTGRLSFSTRREDLAGLEAVWITYDTPVDEDDRADVERVIEQTTAILPYVPQASLVLISSQLPVGSTRRLEDIYRRVRPGGMAAFAYVPENLRLGRAIETFTHPDRVVVGVRDTTDRDRIGRLLKPFTERIEWMSVESAEMTKHALNAFLAASVAFMNEVAVMCERVGADAAEVARGVMSDARIGPRAYLRPGHAFSGGTLARDVSFLEELGRREGLPTDVVLAVRRSNEGHSGWVRRRLIEVFGDVRGRPIAVLGLTYKPGTDTLRRSSTVETCRWLHERGATVVAYDPVVKKLPVEVKACIDLRPSVEEVLCGAAAVLVATEWPEFTSITADDLVRCMPQPIVLDPGRFLETNLSRDKRIRYLAVGRGA